jgi:hypothetical protein
VRRLLLALLFVLSPVVAHGQGCGPTNPNCIVPTAPPGTSNNQAASTAFVQNAISGGTPGAPSTSVQYNNSGAFAGSANLTWNNGTNTLLTSLLNFNVVAGNGINDQTAVAGSVATYWTSSGAAIVHRMNRLLVGPAASNGTGCPSVPNSWMNSIVGGTCDIASIVVDGSLGNAITAGGKTSITCAAGIGCPSGGSAGAYLFGYNDDNTSGNIALGSNSVGFAKSGTAGIVLGAQQDINCATTAYVSTPASPYNPSGGTCIALLLTAGAFSFTTTSSSAALVINEGTAHVFEKGIVVTSNALDTAQGSGGDGVAIDMYPGQTMRWYNGTTVLAELGTSNAGTFGLLTNSSQWSINGVATVSCPAGTVSGATVTFTNGIATHC